MTSLFDLGEDVIVLIASYVTLPDILSLSLTCFKLHSWLDTNEVYHQLFLRKYGPLTPLEATKMRNSKKLQFFTWGSGERGRLGYFLRDAPRSNCSSYSFGIHSNFGFSFQLRVNGRIYCLGLGYTDNSGRPTSPDLPMAHHSTQSHGMSIESPNHDSRVDSWEYRIKSNPLISMLKLSHTKNEREIREISNVIGRVFTWDSGNSPPDIGVKVRFPGVDTPVKKICAGWDISVCQIEGIGLLYWLSRENIRKESYEANKLESNAHYSIVPNLKCAIDFVALSGVIIMLDKDGLLRHSELVVESTTHPLNEFNLLIQRLNIQNKTEATYKKLSGCYRTFSVFTDKGQVIIGTVEGNPETWQPQIVLELQSSGVIHIANGDYHQIALTDNGELLSWGLELQRRGCLGLGDIRYNRDGAVTTEGSSSRVKIPMKVLKPGRGKWLAVTAGGWHSGALFLPEFE
ncbi:RCC1/BLIP-II [Metschnikowia bicuspidata]|uniref:RCC1/BLIP-II n=1 Tax=Metschnikowia bicuspidata TaxID=27322 RepID=A0A4P9ZGY6_9ASCO|nr:RCC1/BLIP-II [Metschnikowia bicuspidata]